MGELDLDLKQQLEATVDRYLSDSYNFESRQELIQSDLGYSQNRWQHFSELGWLSIPFDSAFGGAGGSIKDLSRVMQLFGRALVVEPFVSTVGMAGTVLSGSSNQAVKEKYLPGLIEGKSVLALAYDDPMARGNPHYVATRAQAVESGYHLKGEKVAVLNAPQADYFLLSARMSGDDLNPDGLCIFILDAKSSGIEQEVYSLVDGHRAANISLDLTVGADALIAAEGEAGALVSEAVEAGILMLSAEAMGVMQALLDATVEYTGARKQFGVPLNSFQVLRHRMADMFIELERARCVLDSFVQSSLGDGVPVSIDVHHVKVLVGRAGQMIGDAAIQLHGGMGMTDELIVGHYVKRLISINQLLGNPDFHLKKTWEKLA